MNTRRIALTIGIMLCALASFMVLSAIVDLIDGNSDWMAFFVSSLATALIGGLLVLTCIDEAEAEAFSVREGFLVTALSWVVVTGFSALPFLGIGLDFSDAYFEAMSGLTTTGATVLVGLDRLPRGLLLWRALLQGIGGLGIVVMAIIMMPFLRVGGMQLFQSESSDRSEKILPRAIQMLTATAGIYAGLIFVCAVIYAVLGMTIFDAICHALATLSTGGFSTHDASFGYFQSSSLNVTCTLFMILGSLPFVVMIRAFLGKPETLWRDEQVRGFIIFLAGTTLVMAAWLSTTRAISPLAALEAVAFNVVSVITTTGFATEDYTLWGPFAVAMFLLLTFVGGCAGSTSGGIKIYRFQITGRLTRGHLKHLTTPHRMVAQRYNGRRLADDVPFSVIAFLAVYIMTVGIFTILLASLGLDIVTALSSAATAIGNVGPGLGPTVGPAGNFSTLPDSAKWILSLAMLLGRLELFTVLVIVQPEYWRH